MYQWRGVCESISKSLWCAIIYECSCTNGGVSVSPLVSPCGVL